LSLGGKTFWVKKPIRKIPGGGGFVLREIWWDRMLFLTGYFLVRNLLGISTTQGEGRENIDSRIRKGKPLFLG